MDTLILDDALPYWAEPFYDGDTLQLSRQGTEILDWMEKLGTAQGTACAQAIRDWDIAKARENGLTELSAQWRTQSRAPHEVGQLLVAAAAPTECLPCQQMALDDPDPEPEPVEVTPEGLWEGCIGVEGQLTGDGRLIDLDALRWDDEEQLALGTTPLRYVPIDVGAHDGAQVVGRILSIERRPGGILWAKGDLDLDSEVGREAHRQLDKKLTTGVSMDLDDVSFEVRVAEEIAEQVEVALESDTDEPVMPVAREANDDGTVTVVKINSDDEIRVTTDGRIRAATIVAIPAFAEARIGLVASAWAYNPRQARVPEGHGRYSGRWVAMPTHYGRSMSEIRQFVEREGTHD